MSLNLDVSFWTQDADGSVPFFWGADAQDHLVLSDDADIVKKGCGKSFAPFPKGTKYLRMSSTIQHTVVSMIFRAYPHFPFPGRLLLYDIWGIAEF